METPEMVSIDDVDVEDKVRSERRADRASTPSMSAEEALERLHRGETITGVRISRLRLKGTFEKPVLLRRVTLVRPSFDGATFAEEVVFSRCLVDRPNFNRPTTFAKGVSFASSTLIEAKMRRLTVRGPFRADNLRSRGHFRVENSRFEGPARFWEARFEGWVDFKGCDFSQTADFRSLHAENGFVLAECRFRSEALFRGATIEKKFQADHSRFEGLLDLSKAKLHDFAYLEAIEQGDAQRFAFANAVAERILVRPEQVSGRLESEETGKHAQAMQEYGLLKRNFEGLHRYDDEDWAFYRFKVNQRLSRPRSWRRPRSKLGEFADWLILDLGCGYGTSPRRAIKAAIAIIFAFALIYAIGIGSMHVDMEHMPFAGPKESFANRSMIGLSTSVSAFTSGFGDLRDTGRGWMNLPLIAESLMGTLLWGLFIVAFSRKVIR